MRLIYSLMFMLPVLCYGQVIPKYNRPENNGMINKTKVDSINGKPIAYYLSHTKIDAYSKAFYNGQFGLFDNDESFGIMDSALTANADTRPFYFYNLCRMMEISDGAVSEALADYCSSFVTKFPCTFFQSKYSIPSWGGMVGFTLDDGTYNAYAVNISKEVATHCPDCEARKNKFLSEVKKNLNN